MSRKQSWRRLNSKRDVPDDGRYEDLIKKQIEEEEEKQKERVAAIEVIAIAEEGRRSSRSKESITTVAATNNNTNTATNKNNNSSISSISSIAAPNHPNHPSTSSKLGQKAGTKVKFSSIVDLIYIPSAKEYKDSNIDLWYSDAERCKNISNVHREMQWAKGLHDKIDDRTARRILYQPLDSDFKDIWKKRLFDSSTIYYEKRTGEESSEPRAELLRIENKQDYLAEIFEMTDNGSDNNHKSASNYECDNLKGTTNITISTGTNDHNQRNDNCSFDEQHRDTIQWLDISSFLHSEPKAVPPGTPMSPGGSAPKETESYSLEEALLQELFDFPLFEDISNSPRGSLSKVEQISTTNAAANSTITTSGSNSCGSVGAGIGAGAVPYGISFGRTLHPFSDKMNEKRSPILYNLNSSDLKLGYFLRKPNKTFQHQKSKNIDSKIADGMLHTQTLSGQSKDKKLHPLAYLCS